MDAEVETPQGADGYSNRRWRCQPSFNVLDQCAPDTLCLHRQHACTPHRIVVLTAACLVSPVCACAAWAPTFRW
jgi:hypothetical protein